MISIHRLRLQLKQFVPLFIIIPSFIILILSLPKFILPYTLNLIERFKDLQKQEEEVKKLESKLEILNAIPVADLRADAATLERVLPSEKDAFTVIGSINDIARRSSGILDDFVLSPGLISTPSANATPESSKNAFTIKMRLPESRLVESLKLFYTSTPIYTLSEILASYHSSGEIDAEYKVQTHTLPYPQTFGTTISTVAPLTQAKKDLITLLTKWELPPTDQAELSTATFSGKRKDLFSF